QVGVQLVQVRDELSTDDRFLPPASRGALGVWEAGFEELTTPFEGALQARQAIMAFNNHRKVQMLTDILGPEVFSTVVCPCAAKVAMSWYITKDETALMDYSAREEQALEALRKQVPTPTARQEASRRSWEKIKETQPGQAEKIRNLAAENQQNLKKK